MPFDLVMLVDDSSIDNFINERMIEKFQFSTETIVFTKPVKALEYLEQCEVGLTPAPQVIFLDLNMPLVNGHDFIKRFNDFPGVIKAGCRIVILSSSLNPADMKNSMSSKCVISFLNKPLMKNNLESVSHIMDQILATSHSRLSP